MSPFTRRRGAQPGNQNARTHGFYSTLPRLDELSLFPQESASELDEQVDVIRHYMQRVSELGQGSQDLSQMINILRSMCVASSRLGQLRRRQALLAMLNTNKAQIEQLLQFIKATVEQNQ